MQLTVILTATAVVVLLASQNASVVKGDVGSKSWEYAPPGNRTTINGKEYLISGKYLYGSLSEAHDYCESHGMYLVSFDTAFEFEAVQGRLKEDFSSHLSFWTSGFRAKSTGYWFWQSTKRLLNSQFIYWSGNQPQVSADKDACIYINEPDYLWYDLRMAECERQKKFNFICEALDQS